MIRRNWPLTEEPSHWLLIPQHEHAMLSHRLAAAWRGQHAGCLLPQETAGREEFLQTIRQHDRGWLTWDEAPKIDPEHGRPYGFTEMLPADAQPIWTDSIRACRDLGPLAGWAVAGHFIHLQSKQDHDYPQWAPWLDRYESLRSEWLREWLGQAPHRTKAQAEEALFLLQTFDWISLWLCCRAPLSEDDPQESMDLGEERFQFGPYHFCAAPSGVSVDPVPFDTSSLDRLNLTAHALLVPVGEYQSTGELLSVAVRKKIEWTVGA